MPSRPVLIGRGLVLHTHHHSKPAPMFASTTQFPTNKPPPGGLIGTPELNKAWKHPQTNVLGACVSARVTAAIAKGKHPVPSRTRKLSLSAPMVLQPEGCGRV